MDAKKLNAPNVQSTKDDTASNEASSTSTFSESSFDKALKSFLDLSLSKKQALHKLLVMASCQYFTVGQVSGYQKIFKVLRDDSATSAKTDEQLNLWYSEIVGLKLTRKGNDYQFKKMPKSASHTYDKHHLAYLKSVAYFDMKLIEFEKEYVEINGEKLLESLAVKLATGAALGEVSLEELKAKLESLYGAVLLEMNSDKVKKSVERRESLKLKGKDN